MRGVQTTKRNEPMKSLETPELQVFPEFTGPEYGPEAIVPSELGGPGRLEAV